MTKIDRSGLKLWSLQSDLKYNEGWLHVGYVWGLNVHIHSSLYETYFFTLALSVNGVAVSAGKIILSNWMCASITSGNRLVYIGCMKEYKCLKHVIVKRWTPT